MHGSAIGGVRDSPGKPLVHVTVVVEGQTDLTQIIPTLSLLRLAVPLSESRRKDRQQRANRNRTDQQRPQAGTRSWCWPVCGRIRIRQFNARGGVAILAHVFSGVWFESRNNNDWRENRFIYADYPVFVRERFSREARNGSFVGECQRPDSTRGRADFQHRPLDTSAEVADRYAEIGG